MTENELKEVLRLHKKWLDGEPDGERADLHEADLHYADLQEVDLSCANLNFANLYGAFPYGAILCHAKLRGANLATANLRSADLSYADLSRADLSYTDLSGADLQGADLSGANLQGADLSGANLQGADLSGANLQGAECGFDAFFGSAKGAPIYQAVCGFGSRNAALTLLAQGERKDWRWFTGCFAGSETKLRRAVAREHGNSKAGKEYLLAIDYLVAQAELNAEDND